MTSTFATNYVFKTIGTSYHLHATKDGQPLQKQVPQTYQTYTGNGNETIVVTGENNFIVDSTLSAGPLTLDITNRVDLYGRVIEFIFPVQGLNNVIFNYASGFNLILAKDNTVSSTRSITTNQFPGKITCNFFDIEKALLSVTSTNSNTEPQFLQYKYLGGILNNAVSTPIQWEEDDPFLYNSSQPTSWTLDSNTFFIFSNESLGLYRVHYKLHIDGNLNKVLFADINIGLNAGTPSDRSRSYTSASLNGLQITDEVILNVTSAANAISVSFGSDAGPDAGTDPVTAPEVKTGYIVLEKLN